MDNSNERRRFWRAAFDAPACLRVAGKAFDVAIIDLSLKGALVESAEALACAAGEPAELQLPLSAEEAITMQTAIAHAAGRRLGLRCEEIDLDSITHLRRLVELNCGDPRQLEREFSLLGA